MSNTGKVKLYKNKDRDRAVEVKPYVPQYQIRGVVPEEFVGKTEVDPSMVFKQEPLPLDNPRATRPLVRQPYAEAVPSPIGRGRGLLPNVGNNMERTWSGVDAEVIDDVGLDPNHQMIDNNDFVSSAALGIQEDADPNFTFPVADDTEEKFLTEERSNDALQISLEEEQLFKTIYTLDEDEYLVLVDGVSVCTGDINIVQQQTRDLVFGNHQAYNGSSVPIDDIVVLKRVKIKVGLFLE